MKLTFYGHSCFSLKIKDTEILFDPFITPNELASNINIQDIKPDYVLISHGHQDHIADALIIWENSNPVFVSNFEIISWLENQGVKGGHPMNIGGEKEFGFGKVKSVNAVHSSALPDGSNGGNPGGFIIRAEGMTIYYAGDTALHYDMKMLGELYDIDVALLPIGDNFTMGIEDAIIASKYIDCKNVIGMHFDTFGYIKIDHLKAVESFDENGIKLTLPVVGETIDL